MSSQISDNDIPDNAPENDNDTGSTLIFHAKDDAEFKTAVLDATEPVLVDFWAEWCGPCKMIEPVVTAIAKKYAGQLKVVKVNVEEASGVAQAYDVRGIPTLMIFKQGEKVTAKVGALHTEELNKLVEDNL